MAHTHIHTCTCTGICCVPLWMYDVISTSSANSTCSNVQLNGEELVGWLVGWLVASGCCGGCWPLHALYVLYILHMYILLYASSLDKLALIRHQMAARQKHNRLVLAAMHQCTNAQTHHTNAPMHQCSNAQMHHRWALVRNVFNGASMKPDWIKAPLCVSDVHTVAVEIRSPSVLSQCWSNCWCLNESRFVHCVCQLYK